MDGDIAFGTEGGSVKMMNILTRIYYYYIEKSSLFKGHKTRCNCIVYYERYDLFASSSNDSIIVFFIYFIGMEY